MSNKKLIYKQLLQLIEINIASAKSAMDAAMESKNNETKSSAGDKFETGRAMMQAEQDRYKVQWQKAIELRNILRQIDLEKEYRRVEQGSFVRTTIGDFFVSIGLGKVMVGVTKYYAISLDSPMGKALYHHGKDDRIVFQQKEIRILSVQ